MEPADSKYNYSITFADGITWAITAEGATGINIAQLMAKTMLFSSAKPIWQRKLLIKNGSILGNKPIHPLVANCLNYSFDSGKPIDCHLFTPKDETDLTFQLLALSMIFCGQAEAIGGFLIHGALAEIDGQGVILAGPSDVGKTTASFRLPSPWQSLSDDCSLIVLDKDGNYRVHPWPTWSSFLFGGTGATWNVQYSVPLKALFILSQNDENRLEPLGQGRAVCLLTEAAEQAWWALFALSSELEDGEKKKRQAMSLQRFNNICELTKKIPAYLLHISKQGSFWKEIEKVLSST
jgi:hypothetical protein